MTMPVELGPRSLEVMRLLWSSDAPVASRTLYKLLHERYAFSYTTVTNMLYRLVSQDLLIRHYDRRAAISLYCPTCGPEEYIRQVTAQLRTAVGLDA